MFILNCIIIYKGTWAFHHSDGSTAVMFAKEQLEQGKLYPDGWHNGTGIWNFGLNTIIMPFLAICKEWLNARACAVMAQTLLMVGVLLAFRKLTIISKRWWIVALALFLPLSEVVSEHFYFQATYMTAVMSLAVIYIFVFTGMGRARYLLWIYFYSIINLGIWIDNFNNMEFTYAKELKVGFVLYFMVLIMGVYSYYLTYDYERNPDVLGINNRYRDYKIDYDLLNYMEENDYEFGYAYYWLTSDKWYKEDVHEGECFVLVLNRQLETLPLEYVDRAIRRDEYNNHTIFVYDDVKTVYSIWNTLSGFQY